MRRILCTAAVAAIALSGCSSSSGPSQAQLAAETKWQHGQGGKYLAQVAAYMEAVNRNADSAFIIGSGLAATAALASAFPPPIDPGVYKTVMLDYGTAGDDVSGDNVNDKVNVNGFIAKVDAAGALLTSVKPPWGASLPGGKNF
jgi:hypothetical protein